MPELRYPQAVKKLNREQREQLVARARESIEDAYNFDRDNRREALIDLAFVGGDQWPAAVKAARGNTRPMLMINQLPQFVYQVTNPTRDADIAIKAVPVDDIADPKIAKIFNGLIKQIEYQSTAKTVYVTGNEHQAKCGIGWWRVCTEYVDDAIFDQEIKLKRINNPLAVYCDPAAIEPSREDAMWMAVVEAWPRKTFKKRYPKADEAGVDAPDQAGGTEGMFWATEDTVMVCEWYEKVPTKKWLALLESGKTVDITGRQMEELAQLDQQDAIVQTRECDTFKVLKYLISGNDVLEGPIEWAGKYIPLIPVIGAETPVGQTIRRYGVVRFARDPQQLMNFYRTAMAESIALAPKAPYLVTQKQIGAHKNYWDTANTENRPYLPYTPDPEAPGIKPAREPPPETPVAIMQAAQVVADDMNKVTGIYPASMGARSNEISGIAISQRERQGDNANSHFADNLMHSLVHTGRILIDLIPKIYDTQRVIRLLDEYGKEEQVTINQVIMGVDGVPILVNDLSVGRFDVRVTVGKSYVTKRVETMNAMLEFAKGLPPQAQILFLDLIAKTSDWPGSEELAKRLRTLVPPEALADPNDPEAPKPPDPMDDPMTIAALEKLAAEIEDLAASARQKDAGALKAIAEADQVDAQTGQIVMPTVQGEWPQLGSDAAQEPPAQPPGAEMAPPGAPAPQ